MWLKFLLGVFFLLSLLGAFVLAPPPGSSRANEHEHSGHEGTRLRLLTWNIGNGDLETETRAHDEDLQDVAKVISDNDPDAVALQELTGEAQLKLLLAHLQHRYSGFVCNSGSADRVEAVLVKKDEDAAKSGGTRFESINAGERFAAAARFQLQSSPEIVLVSAHADAFSASRRRAFVEKVVDWTRSQPERRIVFVAGDFNFEVSTRNKSNLFTDDAKHDSESYAYLLKYSRDLGRDAGETSVNDRRIDYVFGPPGSVSLSRAEVLRGSAVGRMDHWPLLVEVTF
ncbi:MAG TPA: endonuclease/exonuclease/phosphatase family protein [Pyrinomonadaceae bacterium]|jgi:endonuclease/exonuclease/phosphatase family metal-dependent hydrolase